MKIWVKRISLGLGAVLLMVIIAAVFLFYRELQTLATLKEVDGYPLYTMTYSGDYGFDDFLKTGAQSDRDIERFVIKRLLKGMDIDLNITAGGCTAFSATNTDGEAIYGRNFDFDYAPPVLVRTDPKEGYASISMVNLAFAGYGKGNLPKPMTTGSFLTLAAPYLPFDGMNEKGVVMALLAVPYAEPPQKAEQVTLNTTTAIRLVLDKAASVDEAVELLRKYNYYFSADVTCHYLIADKSGKSVLVEFLDKDIKVTERTGDFQIASNFIAYNGINVGEGGTEFQRYDAVESALGQTNGILDERDAMALLSKVAMPGRCQWSVVYNLNKLGVDVCVGEEYNKTYHYEMK